LCDRERRRDRRHFDLSTQIATILSENGDRFSLKTISYAKIVTAITPRVAALDKFVNCRI